MQLGGFDQAGEQFLARRELKLASRSHMFEPADDVPVTGGGVGVQLEHVGALVRVAGIGAQDHRLCSLVTFGTGDSVRTPASRVVRERSGFGLDWAGGGKMPVEATDAGLQEFQQAPVPCCGAPPATLDELIARVAELPLAYEPGTVPHYSIGFDVMTLVIERVTGMPYDRFLRERLFEPLKMTSKGFQVQRKDAHRLTTNYDAIGRGAGWAERAVPIPLYRVAGTQDDRATSEWLEPPRWFAGGAGLVSTPRDFLRYAQMLLNEGALESTRVMKVETARMAVGNINPRGIAEPSEGVGSDTRALLMTAPIIPPGMFGGGGSAATLFWIDQQSRGAVIFMAQVLYGSPARSPFQKRLFAAIEQDVGNLTA